MHTFNVRNVNEAWAVFCMHMQDPYFLNSHTRIARPRDVAVREFTTPVATTYAHPEECVLADPVRDANPFFHIYEALWMLAGHNDVARLQAYNQQITAYSDDGVSFHGAYGERWRNRFGFDQLELLLHLLRKEPHTRRAVLSMWGAAEDLSRNGHDLPCNTTAYFSLRDDALHLTVCNRSNDAVWGCYGANAVHFAVLLQYMAAGLGVSVGTYTQFSNNLHVYLEGKAGEVWQRCQTQPPMLRATYDPALIDAMQYTPLISNFAAFDREVKLLVAPPDGLPGQHQYTEPWLADIAVPMLLAHFGHRSGDTEEAIALLDGELDRQTHKDPWLVAGAAWLRRRQERRRAAA